MSEYLRVHGWFTRTEYQLMFYLDICEDIRVHIPYESRAIYQKYFERFAKAKIKHQQFLSLPDWQQTLIRLYSAGGDLL